MNPLSWLYQFITDTKTKISHRFAVIIVIVTAVIIIDNILGVSFHYRISHKIEELQEVNSIIQNPLSDSITKNYAIGIRNKIIARKSVADYLSFRYMFRSSSKPQISPTKETPIKIDSAIKNNLLFTLTSGGFFFLLALLSIGGVIAADGDDFKFVEKLAIAIVVFVFIGGIGVLLSFLLGIVPRIGKNWTFNYILNAAIQVGSIWLFFWLNEKRNKILDAEDEDKRQISK